MGQYDITLKSMFRTGGRGFLKFLGVDGPLRPLDLEFASVKERRVDFLAEMGAGRLLHIEFQATKDTNFVFRMLGYYGEILERVADQCRAERRPPPLQTEIRQILIHLGEDRWRHADALRHANLSFRFEIFDVIDIDGVALVETGDVADAVVAILCRDGTKADCKAYRQGAGGTAARCHGSIDRPIQFTSSFIKVETGDG